MSNPYEETALTMMITTQDHQAAQVFYSHHKDARKGRQVYLNTLAVRAVDRYLKYFGIQSDVERSASFDLVSQHLLDTGALHIPEVGNIECRPVLSPADTVYVPEEVQSDLLGYVIVRLDSELEAVTLLGFLRKVEAEYIALSNLQPIEEILEIVAPIPGIVSTLGNWLQNSIESGWQVVDELLRSSQPTFAFRSKTGALAPGATNPKDVVRGKLVTLTSQKPANSLLMVVGVCPYHREELDIWVKVFPTGADTHLPYDLELKLLDDEDIALMQAQSRETETIGLQFRGTVGDQFSIQISSSNDTHTEYFSI